MNLLTSKEELISKFTFPSDGNVAKAFNKYVNLIIENSEGEFEPSKVITLSVITYFLTLISDNSKRFFSKGIDIDTSTMYSACDEALKLIQMTKLVNTNDLTTDMLYSRSVSWQRGDAPSEEEFKDCFKTNAENITEEMINAGNIIVLLPFKEAFSTIYPRKNFAPYRYTVLYNSEKSELPDYFIWEIPTKSSPKHKFKTIQLFPNSKAENGFVYAIKSLLPDIAKELSIKAVNDITLIYFCLLLVTLVKKYGHQKLTYDKLEEYFKLKFFCYDAVRQALIKRAVQGSVYKREAKEEERLKKLYTTSFMTLQSNTKQAQEVASKSAYVKDFSLVELDGTGTAKTKVDYDKFDTLQKGWKHVYGLLPKMSSKPKLRFRKLGHYKAIGVYFPYFNCICVDVRNTTSFVHEYGHYLDYQKYNRPSLNNNDFLDFTLTYRKELQPVLDNKSKLNYYTLPTEIFARCFEVYIYSQNQNDSELAMYLDSRRFNSAEYQPILKHWQELKTLMKGIIK